MGFPRSRRRLGAVFTIWLLVAIGCTDKVTVSTVPVSDFFTQDFNPPYFDVLWVVDDRSPMARASSHLVSEATAFFQRLDASTARYRMEFISTDMQYAKGALKIASPLTKGIGDLTLRTGLFASTFQNIINLKTGGLSQGIEAADVALTNYFQPQAGVPMILVFFSDSYDVSNIPSSASSITSYYTGELLKIMNNKTELLRVYSINYNSTSDNCATEYHTDIQNDPTHTNNPYFLLAQGLSGSTGGLCGGFASSIDLSGIRLKTLPNRFKLGGVPTHPLQVLITKNGQQLTTPEWYYDASMNEVVFATTPEEGCTIQIIR
ncbi:MAG: hypothetical protein HYR96_14535 [Deltaproteobacteria bacterium]|nr:hypothetical protein [Deltaproteobacteria bacterium]MBI3295518.1 hypothetical protein [Deltaproteobacteria bacterium]